MCVPALTSGVYKLTGLGKEGGKSFAGSREQKPGDVPTFLKRENVGTSPGLQNVRTSKVVGRRPHFFFGHPECGDVAKMWGRRKM